LKFPSRSIFLVGFVCAVGALFFAGIWLHSLASRSPETLPVLGAVPAFSSQNLNGFVWVADVIDPSDATSFARSLRMADFQAAFERAKNVRLVTFVIGSGDASAGALSRLAASFNAVPERWIFASGSPVPALAGFLVVDREGNIRARIPESKPSASSDVLDAVGDLLREGHPR
jgi:hypothetical protein